MLTLNQVQSFLFLAYFPYLKKYNKFWEELIAYDTDRIENYVSNNSSNVACVLVTAVTFLPSHCLVTIGGFLRNRVVT
jgi:hypothetical protein